MTDPDSGHSAAELLIRSVAAPFFGLLQRAVVVLGERAKADGFELVNLAQREKRGILFARLSDTVRLVAEHDPHRLRRIRRDVRRLVVVPAGGSEGAYWRAVDACVFGEDHLLHDGVASVAMTLVHEAMHARLSRAGIRYRPALRARIEAACLQAEIEFGSRIPGAEPLVAEARQAHRTPWWDEDALAARRARYLRSLGWPTWLIRVSLGRFKR